MFPKRLSNKGGIYTFNWSKIALNFKGTKKVLDEIQKKIADNNVKFFGVADLVKYGNKLKSHGYPIVGEHKKLISIGISLNDYIVEQLGKEAEKSQIALYRHFCYDLINHRIDNILLSISEIITANGFQALPIHTSRTENQKELFGLFSHKAAAYLAGLGWIGKSCLLITKNHGPRVRWGTILTNAPLPHTGDPQIDACGKCNICVQKCPAQAFTGASFDMNDRREVRYDAHKCHQYLNKMEKKYGYRVCGICVKVCPFGKTRNE